MFLQTATTGDQQSSQVASIQQSNGIVSTHLQHVKQSGLSGIVETQEKQLRVLVKQSQGGQHIVDYTQHVSAHSSRKRCIAGEYIHQLTIHMLSMY